MMSSLYMLIIVAALVGLVPEDKSRDAALRDADLRDAEDEIINLMGLCACNSSECSTKMYWRVVIHGSTVILVMIDNNTPRYSYKRERTALRYWTETAHDKLEDTNNNQRECQPITMISIIIDIMIFFRDAAMSTRDLVKSCIEQNDKTSCYLDSVTSKSGWYYKFWETHCDSTFHNVCDSERLNYEGVMRHSESHYRYGIYSFFEQIFFYILCLFYYIVIWNHMVSELFQYFNPASTLSAKDPKSINCSGKPDSPMTLLSDILTFKPWRNMGVNLWVYTVPGYPDNHNPLLPLSLQQRLNEMSPREFLTYVLNDLTLEERDSLMVDETQRRKTFLINWPHSNNLSGIRMAQAGFYSLDDSDRVQCVFCRGSLHRWESDDNPMTEHARSFNFCRFVKGLECGNREYKSDKLDDEHMHNITQFPAIVDIERQSNGRDGVMDSGSLGISTNRASSIQYAPEATRLKTFSRWPASSPISGQRMCDAGFYFTGFDDQVRCFYCYGGIKEWSTNDDPWEEHARWFPDCTFLIQQKGQNYVEQVHARTPNNKKCVRKTKSEKRAEIKQTEYKSEQEDMLVVCKEMGHSAEAINRAIEQNGRPFDNVKDMIDGIYELDDDSRPPSPVNSTIHPMITDSICPEEDLARSRDQQFEITQLSLSNGRRRAPRFEMGCRNCENRIEHFEQATHVGLPCGHVIYCDACNTEVFRKSQNPSYKAVCPLGNCGAQLSGTMRMYLA